MDELSEFGAAAGPMPIRGYVASRHKPQRDQASGAFPRCALCHREISEVHDPDRAPYWRHWCFTFTI